ncbi:hypothetical protein RB195_010893 [Necator americanus]|uniref:Uncharacterized protein n=1 Tax=Necator americanus TaxID=51031 RepID=A0ABR1CZY3_NECAM
MGFGGMLDDFLQYMGGFRHITVQEYLQGCDGLDTSQKSGEEEETCNSSVHSLASKNASLLLEQPQSSSVLCGVPLACIVFYDPHERRKRGLDKASMETCFAIVDNAVNTTSIMCARLSWRLLSVCLEGLRFFLANTLKLFHAEEISIDLQMDVERLGRYLVKKGLSVDEIVCLLPMKWLSDIIRTMG